MLNNKPDKKETAAFLGGLISFRNSLKLIHWSITGKGSYEAHLSLDEAIDTLADVLIAWLKLHLHWRAHWI